MRNSNVCTNLDLAKVDPKSRIGINHGQLKGLGFSVLAVKNTLELLRWSGPVGDLRINGKRLRHREKLGQL